ncbi:MAG: hypothetical protein KDA41_06455 [Planctomycetales bacterium]|nr:hypothetical protein [Planctomycetales bacterium]
MNPTPAAPDASPTRSAPWTAGTIAAVAALAVCVAIAGLPIGWLMTYLRRYGSLADLLLLALGIASGAAARRIVGRGAPWVSVMLAVAMGVALFLTLAGWLYWSAVVDRWSDAFKVVLRLPQVGLRPLLCSLIWAGLGAYCACVSAGSKHYRVW